MPMDAMAITNSTATGRSVTWRRVETPKISTCPPNGITVHVVKAAIPVRTGAKLNTHLSVCCGRKSSLTSSFAPSASA